MSVGTIDQLPSGRWRLRVNVAGKQVTVGTYDSNELAERARPEASKIARSGSREYEGLTVQELGKRILTRREVKREVRDPGSDWSRWDTHIKPDEIAKFGVSRLQPKHVHAWIGRLKEKGLATQTIRNCRNLLSIVLREACEQGLIKTNPTAEIRMRAPKVSAEAGWTYLVPAEQMTLVNAVPMPERCLVAFAIGSGLRAGELCALRRVDVDIEGRRLMVRFGEPPDQPTKTGKVRLVPLFGMALEAAQAWLAVFPARAGAEAMFPLPGDRTNRYGDYRDPDHVIDWKVWKAALLESGLSRRVRWHDLRHTCASSLVSGWWGRRWSLQEVKEMLGHTTIDVTQRYAHLAPGALEEAGTATIGASVMQVTAALPQLGSVAVPSEPNSAAMCVAPPAGIGPTANGLGKLRDCAFDAPIHADDLGVTVELKRALAAVHGDVGGRVLRGAP
jgi:integrase